MLQLLAVNVPLVIYTSSDLEPFIWRHRRPFNTCIRRLTLASLEQDFKAFDTVARIRSNSAWRNQAPWLSGSPQATLAHYNPLVMSKPALLAATAADDPFQSEHWVWLDAGIARTCAGALTETALPWQLTVLLQSLQNRLLTLAYPYLQGTEIHGFARSAMARWANTNSVRWVTRGGLFGGSRAAIEAAYRHYQQTLDATLEAGYMGTEESVLTIVAHRHPELFHREMLGEDGLLAPFLQKLLNAPMQPSAPNQAGVNPKPRPPAPLPTATPQPLSVYILTFNAPKQLELLLQSWHGELHSLPALRLHIVDNSNEASYRAENLQLCQRHGAVHLAQGNLGICGGRQFIADHFDQSGAAYMLFLEDDMLCCDKDGTCRSGLPRRAERLLRRALAILIAARLDFLKLSFTEFFGSNDQQWAWHNVTDERRAALWPMHPRRSSGLALDEIPAVRFSRIGHLDGLAYAVGEVFYSNWPQLVTRAGNRRMFLETRWRQPFEQTWMAHLYERSLRGELAGGVLLASPIEHRREHHYAAHERLES